MSQKLFNAKQVAEIINVRPATIYQWVNQRKIPYVKLGEKTIRFRPKEIDRWIEENAIKALD